MVQRTPDSSRPPTPRPRPIVSRPLLDDTDCSCGPCTHRAWLVDATVTAPCTCVMCARYAGRVLAAVTADDQAQWLASLDRHAAHCHPREAS